MLAIETEVHGFTIVELLNEADVRPGDEISWESDLATGAQSFNNDSTKRQLSVLVHGHLVSRHAVRQKLLGSLM